MQVFSTSDGLFGQKRCDEVSFSTISPSYKVQSCYLYVRLLHDFNVSLEKSTEDDVATFPLDFSLVISVLDDQIQPEYGDEQAGAGRDCRTRLARPNSQARTRTGKYELSLFS